MTTFDERETAFERKFTHDAEMQFRAGARRNKLLGLWAADLMGLSGDDAARICENRGHIGFGRSRPRRCVSQGIR